MSLGERLLDGLVAVGRLGDDLEVGLGVEHHSQSAQDDRMVVGDEDAGLQWGRHVASRFEGDGEPDLGAAARRLGDGELGADEHRAFAHAADAVGGPEGVRRKSAAVVANRQDDVLACALEAELRPASASACRATFVSASCATR